MGGSGKAHGTVRKHGSSSGVVAPTTARAPTRSSPTASHVTGAARRARDGGTLASLRRRPRTRWVVATLVVSPCRSELRVTGGGRPAAAFALGHLRRRMLGDVSGPTGDLREPGGSIPHKYVLTTRPCHSNDTHLDKGGRVLRSSVTTSTGRKLLPTIVSRNQMDNQE
jgi:hypothetical protein